MMLQNQAHSGMRPVIALIGKRNAGKSSLMNQLIGQEVSIVSPELGTTTDAVGKAYELIPVGAVTIYDTAGLDDEGALGEKRVQAAQKIIERADVVIYVIGREGITSDVATTLRELHLKGTKFIPVLNFADEMVFDKSTTAALSLYQGISVSAKTGEGIDALRQRLVELIQTVEQGQSMIPDLVMAKDVVVLVTPIDTETPKGRMIMPQVQATRELLDRKAIVVTTQPETLQETLRSLKTKPILVITDSQAVKQVAEIVPEDIALTTFSILMARAKWNIHQVMEGIDALQWLRDGDKVLIAEGCSHRVTCHDIGRSLIPNLLQKFMGLKLDFDFTAGQDFPDDITAYKVVIHCGGCMLNQKEVERRLKICVAKKVPVTNYGMLISLAQGVYERVTEPVV